jgi:outer membrane lipoprotein carrier protein
MRRIGVPWAITALSLGLVGIGTALAQTTAASALPTALDRYLDGLKTLRADFTQAVSDAQGKSSQAGSGTLLLARPNRFRWDYQPAGSAGSAGSAGAGADDSGQLLIADGRNLWFLDRELAQVTVKPIDAALSSTPIMLLSGTSTALRAQFDVESLPAQSGLDWVQVRPHSAQADFSEARLGFRSGELVRMLVRNMLGQVVQLDFTHSRRNVPVDPTMFNFSPPSGVDVIGTPQPVPATP